MAGNARQWRRVGAVIGRGNGKSTGVLAPYILDSLEQGIGVLGLAQNLDVAMETFEQVAEVVESTPARKRRIKKLLHGKGQARLSLRDPRTGNVAVYRPAVTAKKCRGPRAPRLAVDEAAYVDNKVLSAARYVQNGSGQSHLQQILAVCTAGDDAEDENGDLQWFSRWRAAHLEQLDPRLLWLEYSLPDDADYRDPTQWPYAVPALGYFITAQEIADNLDDPKFVQEALSRWGVTSQRAIPAGEWAALALDDELRAAFELDKPTAAGLAVAVTPDPDSVRASVVAAYSWRARIVVKVLKDEPGIEWTVPYLRDWTRGRRLAVQLDGRGPAAPLAASLRSAGVDVHEATTDEYTNACAELRHDVRTGRLAHYGAEQQALDKAAASARWRFIGDRSVWARRAGDIAALEAATLAARVVRHAPRKPRVV
jgi:hypothetical protein